MSYHKLSALNVPFQYIIFIFNTVIMMNNFEISLHDKKYLKNNNYVYLSSLCYVYLLM